jgi:uncharacterized membrane protein
MVEQMIEGRRSAQPAARAHGALGRTLHVRLFGLPAHPVVNDLPGALLPAASLCDLLYLVRRDLGWAAAGYRMLQLGNLSALLAAGLGVLDFLRLPPEPEVRRLATRHAALIASLLPVFGLCQLQRRRRPERPSGAAMVLLFAANMGLNVAAWHGARLVHAHGLATGEQGPPWPLEVQPEAVTWWVSEAPAGAGEPTGSGNGRQAP